MLLGTRRKNFRRIFVVDDRRSEFFGLLVNADDGSHGLDHVTLGIIV